jgi:phage-related protein
MSTGEIDRLELEIKLKNPDKKAISDLRELSKELDRLKSITSDSSFQALKNLKLGVSSSIEKGMSEAKSSVQGVETSIKKVSTTLESVGKQVDFSKAFNFNVAEKQTQDFSASIRTSLDNLAKYKNLRVYNKSLADQIKDFDKLKSFKIDFSKIGLPKQNKGILEPLPTTSQATVDNVIDKADLKRYKKREDDKKPLTSFQKLMNSIKRVAIYRTIRAILKVIARAFKEGIQNLAIFDKNVNKTMSSISTSAEKIKASIGLTFAPVLEAIAPAIEQIANSMVEVGNNISKLTAQMKGLSTYTKISSKYAKDYAQSLNSARKFSFDTFETLGGTASPFETESIDSATSSTSGLFEVINSTREVFSQVYEILSDIMVQLRPLFDMILTSLGRVISIIGGILESLRPVIDSIVNNLLPPIVKIVDLILDLASSILLDIWKAIEPIVSATVDMLAPIIDIIAEQINVIFEILEPIFSISKKIHGVQGESLGLITSMQATLNIIKPILETISALWHGISQGVSGVVKILKGDFIGGINDIKNAFIGVWENVKSIWASWWNEISSAFKTLWGYVSDFFSSLGETAEKVWKSLKKGAWYVVDGIVEGFAWALNRVIDGVNALTSGLSSIWDWIGIPSIPEIPYVNWSVPEFANGGLVGELWQMNEHGQPEMLYNGNNSGNNTSVINRAQLSEAFTEAIYNSGILDAIMNAGVINIDGREIASSKSFKRELNRTNPNLNLR